MSAGFSIPRENIEGAKLARAVGRGKRSKFNNRITFVDGKRFDSAKEAARYGQLKLLLRAGEIRDLELQKKFPMFAWNGADSTSVKIAVYKADFSYFDARKGQYVVEDVKGCKTALYRLKKKIVEANYGVEILET